MENIFKESEFPFEKLSKFGISKDMFLDLPERYLNDVFSGLPSPLLPLSIEDEEGNRVEATARISLLRMDDGSVNILFFPKLSHPASRQDYSMSEQQRLECGRPVLKSLVNAKTGKVEDTYVQLDRKTGNLMSVPADVIEGNIRVWVNNHHLMDMEQRLLRQGDPVELSYRGKPHTIGIDLNAPSCIRYAPCGQSEWEKDEEKEYARYEFGISGCWVFADDGSLDYIPEDDYTDDIIEEQKKRGQQNAQRSAARAY